MISVSPLTRVTPLYGRDPALSPMRRLLAAARSGSGGGLLVTGAPGAGKSAVLDRVREEAHGLATLQARAAPGERDLAMAGLHQLLNPALPYLNRLTPPRREALTSALETGAPGGVLPLANAVLALLTAVAERGPLLVCVDDLHLMDEPSQKILAFVARRFPTKGAALLLSTCERATDRLTGVPTLPLSPLGHTDVLRVLTEAADVAPSVAAEIAAATEGVPGAALEALAATTPEQRAGAIALERPLRTRGALTERFVREIASLPTRVRLALLRLCVEPRHRPVQDLEPAHLAGLVTEDGGRPRPSHPLVRSACYHGASDTERRTAHAEAARAAWLAGGTERARQVLERVDLAPEQVELLNAEMDLRSGVAIDAFQRLGATADRLVEHDPEAALKVLFQAGEAGCLSGDHARFFATAERARVLSCAARIDLESPRNRLILDYMTGKAALFQGRHREGMIALKRVQEAACVVGDPQALVLGGIAGLLRGDQVGTRALAGRAATMARRTGTLTLVPQALEFLTYAELWFGRLSLAEGSATEGLRLAVETGQHNCASHHRAALALVAAVRGEENVCREHAGTALSQAREHDVGLPAGLAVWALAQLDLGAERIAEAAMRLRVLARSGPGSGHVAVRLLITPHLVEASVRGRVPVRVLPAVETFAGWAEETGNDTAQALALRCRGLLARGREAEGYFERALESHASGYCDLEEARTRLLYGGHLRRSRHPGRAREHLYAALEAFQRLGAKPWARQAAKELRAARGSVAVREPGGEGSLSPQQLRIAQHVADGATNREVAARLCLSTRTVDHHLRNIYSKLGIRSRVELSRLVGR
ncbi:helix-turn-helix transcriptional regulator [Nocardiopsis alkaliphila]|uniref:helix-turn-helix transcriptional regulator n=1 Tax=Nocardiopsis alkaliphila TaxID=225762 RepID=UPI000348D080|nr:AAA family ATPase [Nocardiopsis alkaliphila]